MVSDRFALSAQAAHLVLPEGIVSSGWGVVRAKCEQMGTRFDPWQDGLGRAMLAKRKDGQYAAGVGGVCASLPRQVGKTFTVGNMVFGLALTQPGLKVIWTAHRTRTSAETFKALQGLARKPKVAPFVSHVRRANGQEEIEFANGSRILFGARESGFGRGFDAVDVLVFDEAQILTQKPIDDMIATLNSAPNGLALYMGTPPKPSDPCEVFSRFRKDALRGVSRDVLYVEFSAGDDPGRVRVDDRKAWARANPSFPGRTSETALLRLLRQIGEESFRREGLGMWDPDTLDSLAIPSAAWKLVEVEQIPPRRSRPCFAVRFSPDGSLVALGAAGRAGSKQVYVEGLRVEPASIGTGWVLDFLTDPQRLAGTAQIVVEGKSGAGYLIDQLRSAGVSPRVLLTPSVSEVIDAHGMFLASVLEQTLQRVPNQELDREVSVATRRKIGNQGGFGWQAPDGDSTVLLDAVTLAFWACKTTRRRPGLTNEVGKRKKVVIL